MRSAKQALRRNIVKVSNMRVLLACEESQRVCTAFREKGHEAYSCDIMECSGGHPEWHIQQDVLPLLNGNCDFKTTDGRTHRINGKWDMIIAFPPCTYLTAAATQCHSLKKKTLSQIAERTEKRIDAVKFFMKIITAECEKIAVENPVGIMNSFYRKPDQIIHPYFFGDNAMKRTCLWLKNIPILTKNENFIKPEPLYYRHDGKAIHFVEGCKNCKDRAKTRSKTYPGIAKAMAEQWGGKEKTAN